MERILWGRGESRGGSEKGRQLVQALARWTWGPMTLPGRFCSPLPDTGEPDGPRILLPLVALGKGPPCLSLPCLQHLRSWFRNTQTSAACVGVSGCRQSSYE